MNIIGQDNLLNTLNKIPAECFPSSIIIEGDFGSGKHLIASYISNYLQKDLINITSNLSFEYLLNISMKGEPLVYLIDTSIISIKNQNVILKLLEEPPINATLILITLNSELLLPTIRNRCRIFKMEKYKKNILENFLNNKNAILLDYLSTPGQIILFDSEEVLKLDNYSTILIEKVVNASISNLLLKVSALIDPSIKGKMTLNIFLNMLSNKLIKYYSNTANPQYLKCFDLVKKTYYELNCQEFPNINTNRYINNFLITYKNLMKEVY